MVPDRRSNKPFDGIDQPTIQKRNQSEWFIED